MDIEGNDEPEILNDDSNLSSTSLLRSLVEQSDTDLKFFKLSLEEKFKSMKHPVKSSFFEQRQTVHYHGSYNQDVHEHMERTASDRKKLLKDFNIPKYPSEERALKKTFSRPDMYEFHIPLMTTYNKSFVSRSTYSKSTNNRSFLDRPSTRNSNLTYVGKLLSTYATAGPSRPQRVSTIRLSEYKKKIEEGKDEDASEIKLSPNLNNDYTTKQKKMIDEVLGDIPFRRESVYVPYGKLTNQRGIPDETNEKINLSTPVLAEQKLPSYDESLVPSESSRQSRSFRYNRKDPAVRSTMWERSPSIYEFTFNGDAKKTEGSETRGSIKKTE